MQDIFDGPWQPKRPLPSTNWFSTNTRPFPILWLALVNFEPNIYRIYTPQLQSCVSLPRTKSMKMELLVSSETSAIKARTPGDYSKDIIRQKQFVTSQNLFSFRRIYKMGTKRKNVFVLMSDCPCTRHEGVHGQCGRWCITPVTPNLATQGWVGTSWSQPLSLRSWSHWRQFDRKLCPEEAQRLFVFLATGIDPQFLRCSAVS